jgi:hypothetical protein
MQVITSFRYGVIIIFMLLFAIILLSGCQDSVMLMPTTHCTAAKMPEKVPVSNSGM